MSKRLEGKRIAFLATDLFEQVELTEPWEALKSAGAEVELISLHEGEIQGAHHAEKGDRFKVDKTVDECAVKDYDGLVLPGGVHNPDTLRTDPQAVRMVKEFFCQHKPVAAICHGPWLLVEADVIRGRRLTSWPSLTQDIKNAGGEWIDEPVVVDNGLVTSRKPEDLKDFCAKVIEEFCEGKHSQQVAYS